MLYKYRSWKREFHSDCLLKNMLFFSSPKNMNDPFDFKIPPNFSLLNSDETINQYIDICVSKFTKEQIAQMGGLEHLRKSKFNDFEGNPPKAQADYESLFYPIVEKHFGVLCFSQIWNNVLMWSHYADNHSGFCLGFEKQSMLEEFKFGSQGPVHYDEFPNINPLHSNELNTALIQSFYKAPGWAYEKEFRIIKLEYPEELSHKERLHIYSDHCLKEIILGLIIDDTDKTEIIKIGLEKQVPVYQIEKVPLSFEIIRRLMSDKELRGYQ
jgi:hypothetical protein